MYHMRNILGSILGIVFIISGIGKLYNIAAFQYLIIQYGFPTLHYLAPAIVIAEIVLGTLLVLGVMRKWTSLATILLLIIFSFTFAYAQYNNNISECGCFGQFDFADTSPTLTYIRNAILICMASVIFLTEHHTISFPLWKRIIFATVLLPSLFIAGMTYRPYAFNTNKHPLVNVAIKKSPLGNYTIQNKKKQLIFFFSYDCPHCWNSLAHLEAFSSSTIVDTTAAYVLVSPSSKEYTTSRNRFTNYFPQIKATGIHRDSIDFISAMPTSFYIDNDTIKEVIIGTLISPYTLLEELKYKSSSLTQ